MFDAQRIRRVWAFVICLVVVASAGCRTAQRQFAERPQTRAVGTAADARLPSLRQFIEIRSPRSVQAAPDETIYYVDRPEGVYQLYRRRGGLTVLQEKLTDFPDGIDGFSLAPDGKHLVAIASVGGNEQGQLHLMDTSTGRITKLMPDPNVKYGAVLWRNDSRAFAYHANDADRADFHVHIYDLTTGQARRVFAQKGFNFPADFSPDFAKLAVVKAHSNYYSQVFEVDLAGEGWRELTPTDQQRRFRVVGYEPDGRSMIVITDYLGDRDNLVRLSTIDKTTTPITPELEEFEVDGGILSRDRSYLAFVQNRDGYGVLHVRCLPGLEPIEVARIPEGVIGGLRFQGSDLLFTVGSPQNPGTTFMIRLGESGASVERITEPYTAGVDLGTCAMPELVRIRSFDALMVPAFLYLPPGHRKGKPIPFVLSLHGGPEAQYRPRLSGWQQYMLSRGFGILAPNVRGSTGYGTRYQNMDNYKNRLDSVRDALACAHWLIDRGYTQKKMLAAIGGSYGGYMVMACITEEPDLWGAACNIVGIVNFETFLKNTKDYRRHLREAEYGPLGDPGFLRSISPIHKVDQITTPLFVVHGRNDPRVPIGEAEQIVEALRQRNRTVEFIVFDDEGHGVRKLKNRIEFAEKMVNFCRKHLKGEGAAART